MEEYIIVANVISDNRLRTGAKVYLVGGTLGDLTNQIVVGLSKKDGKRIKKWIAVKRLENFRAAWCPPTIKSLADPRWLHAKEDAEKSATIMTYYYGLLRAYTPDGKEVIKHGLPESQVQHERDLQMHIQALGFHARQEIRSNLS